MSYREVKLSDLITDDGYVVVIEGDDDLYEDELAEYLKTNIKNYILLNNIYDNPQKLYELKHIKIDVFIFQTTGVRPELEELIDLYIQNIGNYPKHFVTVYSDGERHFNKVFEQLKTYEVYRYSYIDDNNEMIIIRQDHACEE